MFCPNCGTKNDDTATPCKKCGFKLSGASAPKFRGTMMLNSDQCVQDMVEEHRKKLADAAQSPDVPGAGGPTPPLPSVGSTPPRAVLQPPRATLPKRRMGTMLGVAPQVGGVQPPDFGGTPVPPNPEPVNTPVPVPASERGSGEGVTTANSERSQQPTPAPPADPLAGTVAFGAVPQAAPQLAATRAGDALATGRTEAFAAVPPTPAPAAALAAGRTEAFEVPPAPAPTAPSAEPPRVAVPVPERTEAFDAPTTTGSAKPEESSANIPQTRPRRQVRPLQVFLIIATCGLYGLVLWARQRKPVDER